MKPLTIICVMAFLWAACSGNNNNEPENALQQETQISLEDVSVFECGENFTFTALTASDSVRLFLSDTPSLVLPQTVAASGARYESDDGDIFFGTKATKPCWNLTESLFKTVFIMPANLSGKRRGCRA